MSKNLKITLGTIYLFILISFLYFLFSKFDISRIDDFSYYKLIQANIDEFIGKNLILNLYNRHHLKYIPLNIYEKNLSA